MNTSSTKSLALAAVVALGALMSTSAHANILRTADGVAVTTKAGNPVLVGKDALADCEAEARARAALMAAEAELRRQRTVYFDFNKSDLNKDAKRALRHIAANIKAEEGKTVSVVGYADRMGDAAYNERLALKRAKAVRDFLVGKGLKPASIEVRSLGKSAPRANCAADLPRAKMIICLREDRRVEVEVK